MKDCVFCKIVKGELPCYKVYEDKNVLAFLDISMQYNCHVLVIPKLHTKNTLTATERTLNNVMKAAKKISVHLTTVCGYQGVDILNANEECANQSVMHLHYHIIGRKNNDGQQVFVKCDKKQQNLQDLCSKITMI